MSVPAAFQAAVGSWRGTNDLYMHGEPTRSSPSTASLALVAGQRFVTISYTWAFEGQPQEGMLLIGHNESQANATVAWIDSWHMSDGLMLCPGTSDSQAGVQVRGSYSVDGSPEWGWRINILAATDTLAIVMYNVTPEGLEELAVDARYTRE